MKRLCHLPSLRIVAFHLVLIFLPSITDAAAPSVRLLQPKSWPGGPRNNIYDVAVSGQHAFAALGAAGVGVIDISDPTSGVYVGGSSNVGAAYRLAVQGDYLYVAGRGSGLHIIDITTPLSLRRVGGFTGGAFEANEVAVADGLIFVANYFTGLEIFSLNDSTNCHRVGGYRTSGYTLSVSVAGSRAYIGGHEGLHVIDISDPVSCALLGSYNPGIVVHSIAVSSNYLYLANFNNGLQVVDVSNPTNSVAITSFHPAGQAAWRVRAFDNRLYLEGHSINLHIFDISNPTNLVRLGSISRPGLNDGVAVSGDYAFLGNFYEGLDVLNVSDPTNYRRMYQVGIGGDAHEVAPMGKHALLADGQPGLRILETRSGGRPVQAGNFSEIGFTTCVAASGQLAYVGVRNGGGQNGLRIVDVSNPTNCSLAGSCVANWVGNKVAVTNGFAYVASSQGLQVINVQNPSSSTVIRSGIITFPASDLQLAENHLYLAGYQGLHIVDISNPTNATRIGGWKRSSTDLTYPALSLSWPYAHLACGDEGFNIVDVTTPDSCIRVGGFVDAGFPVNDVALLGPYALLLNSARRQVRVFDVSDPSNCVFITSLKTSGPTKSISVVNGEVFLANGLEGLAVIPSIPQVHKTLRIDAIPNAPFTLEAATNLSDPNSWQPLLTTNVATMPFDFVDFDVKIADKPQKFYRVRQP